MALEPVKLDDLNWSGMVAAIRSRIATVSGTRWTLHAPVDPGITLLELFAWLLEQRVYWLDQVPDSLVRAALTLLGVEAPKPALQAATVLALSDGVQPPQPYRTVPALTQLRLARRTPPLIFSTETGITLLPVQQVSLYIGELDRMADLQQGRVLRLFPADRSFSEVKVVLRLSEPLPMVTPAEPISLFFKLRDLAAIPSQWSPEAVPEVPPPAEVSWLYRNKDGAVVPITSVDDGTGGLRRSGVVTFRIPGDWQAEPNAAMPGGGCYAFWIRVNQATFTAPPRLERLVLNACIARHQRRTQLHRLQQTWLPLPGNALALSELPKDQADKDYPPLGQTVTLRLKERDAQWYPWQATPDLAFQGPCDRVFVVDRESGRLLFGDGLTGRLPVLFQGEGENVEVQYFVGGGTGGNLGENLAWDGNSEQDLGAQNLVPAEGGVDPETMESARQRAAAQLRRRDRAITRPDYEEIARTTPGVAISRAHAAVGYHPSQPCIPVMGAVTLFIVPHAPREEIDEAWVESAFVPAPVPDPGALSAVRARLAAVRLTASEVFVEPPRYRPVVITTEVEADSQDPTQLKQRIEVSLKTFLDPLIGGDEGQGWTFGEPLRPSMLLREAQKALGSDGEAVGVSIRLLDMNLPAENCGDVKVGPHDLLELKELAVHFRHPGISRGGLR